MNNKTWIIFRREYLNIVRRPIFLISTFLVPIGFAAIFGIQILAAVFVEEEDYTILTQSGPMAPIVDRLESTESVTFEQVDLPEDSIRARVKRNENELYLKLPPIMIEDYEQVGQPVLYFGKQKPGNAVFQKIEKKLDKAVDAFRREREGISEDQFKRSQADVELQQKKLTDDGETSSSDNIAMIVGYVICFLMYMLMGIYGSILMQGVIEEKANRVVEIIVSSVRPFQLLMGKTLAIALVGITQFLLWVVLTGVVIGIFVLISPLLNLGADSAAAAQASLEASGPNPMANVDAILIEVENFNWSVLWLFPLYFLGGFFLYGSLFAAVGSAVDNVQDAQQFTFPVTLPMILPILFVVNLIQNPNGSFATFASHFPFFSPMSMMVRVSVTEVPWWEIALSLTLLIAAFMGCVWLAGRIYRTGILMYGKKPTFKELFKWVTYRQ